ncbi:MAG: FtsW/RodA/SpoVE family cell cycle protein [Candidatus Rokubacteria bacterium]|nr:FtsW/RodA/SpoVE family cell cycle protein [Candidatus Rokubacteria bacterium]
MPRKLVPDMWLFGVVVALVSIGVVMVYSASALIAADRFRDPYFFLKKQLFWAVLGFGCLWAAMTPNYRILQRLPAFPAHHVEHHCQVLLVRLSELPACEVFRNLVHERYEAFLIRSNDAVPDTS